MATENWIRCAATGVIHMRITMIVKKMFSQSDEQLFSKVALEPRVDYGISSRMFVNPLMLQGLFQD
jgi:hypothetical protein